jgi:hypothetical protein
VPQVADACYGQELAIGESGDWSGDWRWASGEDWWQGETGINTGRKGQKDNERNIEGAGVIR